MMFFGGLIMGIALEHSNLHRRVALKVIIFFGSSVKNLMAGIMLVTMFLSMWINNTATTAMMIPIVDSILVEIYDAKDESSNGDIGLSVLPSSEDEQESRAKIGHRNGHINGKAVVVAVTETEATEMSLTSQKHNLVIWVLRRISLLTYPPFVIAENSPKSLTALNCLLRYEETVCAMFLLSNLTSTF